MDGPYAPSLEISRTAYRVEDDTALRATPAAGATEIMHPPMLIDGQTVTFDHLAPITRKVRIELQGNMQTTVEVRFLFSCHCYSRGLAEGESAKLGHEVPDGSVHSPRPREFDAERYMLSHRLVALIDQLITLNGHVSKTTRTDRENFYRTDQVETQRDGTQRLVSYFIFFHATKIQEPERPRYLKVFVESAYPEQDHIPHPVGRGGKSFAAMLGETWVGLPPGGPAKKSKKRAKKAKGP